MRKPALCPISAAFWLMAVVGAAAVLVGPITPWIMPVEFAGLTLCAVGSVSLFAWFFRPE